MPILSLQGSTSLCIFALALGVFALMFRQIITSHKYLQSYVENDFSFDRSLTLLVYHPHERNNVLPNLI